MLHGYLSARVPKPGAPLDSNRALRLRATDR